MTDAWTESAAALERAENLEAAADASGYTSFAETARVIEKVESGKTPLSADHQPTFAISPRSVADSIETGDGREAKPEPTRDALVRQVVEEVRPELEAAQQAALDARLDALAMAAEMLPDLTDPEFVDEADQDLVLTIAATGSDEVLNAVIEKLLQYEYPNGWDADLESEEEAQAVAQEIVGRIESFKAAVLDARRDSALAQDAALTNRQTEIEPELRLAAARHAIASLPVYGEVLARSPEKLDAAIEQGVQYLRANPAVLRSFGFESMEALLTSDPETVADAIAQGLLLEDVAGRANASVELQQGMIERNLQTDVASGLTGGAYGQGQPKPKVQWRPDAHLADLLDRDAARTRVTERGVAASLARSTKRASGIEETITGLFKKSKAASDERARRLGA